VLIRCEGRKCIWSGRVVEETLEVDEEVEGKAED
jgi:hypothetical protein